MASYEKTFFFLKISKATKKPEGLAKKKNVIIKIGQSMLEGNMEDPNKD